VRRYPHRVTFQAPTEVRKPSGGVTLTYATVESLTDLPALVIPVTREAQGDRMSLTSDLFEFIIMGDLEVVPAMAAVTDYEPGVFGVVKVARPTTGPMRPLVYATIVTAERVAL
jgi:hypothetical protein